MIRDGLRALQRREKHVSAFWDGVRVKVAEARRDVAAGRTSDGERARGGILAGLSAGSGKRRRATPRKRT